MAACTSEAVSMASVLDSNSLIAPTWKYTQDIIRFDPRLKPYGAVSGHCLCCSITLYIKSVCSVRAPPASLQAAGSHQEAKVLQVLRCFPAFPLGLLDWPRFPGLSPVAPNTAHPQGKARASHPGVAGTGPRRVDVGQPGGKCPECPRWCAVGDP